MKKIISLVSVLMCFLVLCIVVIRSTKYKPNEIIQGNIPEKPAGIEELPPCIDVTSRIRNPIEIVKENQIISIANAD